MSDPEQQKVLLRKVGRRQRYGFVCPLAIAAVWTIKAATGGLTNLLLFLGFGVGILLLATGFVFFQSLSQRGDGQVLWRGTTYFDRSLLAKSNLFPKVKVGTGLGTLLEAGKAYGRLEVRFDGLHWTAGGSHALGVNKVSGEFFISWTDVKSVDVRSEPGKGSWLGGLVTIHSQSLPPITGVFNGYQSALRSAVDMASGRELSSSTS